MSGNNCILASLCEVLRSYGHSVDEEILFFANEGFLITYNNPFTDIHNFKLCHNFWNVFYSFLNKNHIQFTLYTKDHDSNMFIHHIEESIEPIIVLADSKNISYHSIFQTLQNRIHTFVVRKAWMDGIEIFDNFIPTVPPSNFHGKISNDNFIQIINSENFSYLIIDGEKLKNTVNLIGDSFSIDLLRELCIYYISSNNNSYSNLLFQFCNDFILFPQVFSLNDCIEIANKISFSINEGIICARKYFINMIRHFNIRQDIIQRFQDCIKTWNNIILMFLKLAWQNNADYFYRIANRIKDLIKNECELFYSLLQELSKSM